MGLKGLSQLLPVSLGLNPSVQAGEEIKLQRASWEHPVMSCATVEKIGGASSPWWLSVLKVKISHAIKSKRFLPGKGLRGKAARLLGGLSLGAAGEGLWAGTQQVMTLLHSPQVPQGKPSPLGHRVQMLQIVLGWDKEVCKREIAPPRIKRRVLTCSAITGERKMRNKWLICSWIIVWITCFGNRKTGPCSTVRT